MGSFREDSGTVDAPIGRSRSDRKKMAVVAGGRPAITHWEVLARYLGVESVTAHPLCQYNGAIGAAVLGWKRVNR